MARNPEIKVIITGDSKGLTKTLDGVKGQLKQFGTGDVTKNLTSQFKTLGNEIEQTVKPLKDLEQATRKTAMAGDSLANQFTRAFKTFSLFAGAAALVQTAIEAITGFFITGFKAVNDFELQIISLAATMTTFNKEARPETIVEDYQEMRQRAREIVPVMEELAAKTLLSGDNVNRMVIEFAKGGQIIDATNKKQIQSLTNISNALAIILGEQANMKQIGQEVGDLWQGQITMASSLGQVLKGVIGPNIKEQLLIWKEQGILIEKVGETLSAFGAASEDLKNSWQAVASTLETTFKRVLREDFGAINREIINATKELDEFLRTNKQVIREIIDIFAAAVKGARLLGKVLTTIISIYTKIKEASDFVNIPKRILGLTKDTKEATEEQTKALEKQIEVWKEQGTALENIKKLSEEEIKLINNMARAWVGVSEAQREAMGGRVGEGARVTPAGGTVAEEARVQQAGGRVDEAFKIVKAEKEVTLTLNEQINTAIKLNEEKLKTANLSRELTKEEQKAQEEVTKLTEKYAGITQKIEDQNSGLNKHQLSIIEIQTELEEALKLHGQQPELIDAATEAIMKELEASDKLNDSIRERNELSAQEVIAELGTTPEERIKAIQAITEAQLKALDERFEEQKKFAEDETTLLRALELEKRKIILDEAEEIKKIREEMADDAKTNWDEELSSLEDNNMKKGDSYKQFFQEVKDGSNEFTNSLIDNEKNITAQTKEQLDKRTDLLRKNLQESKSITEQASEATTRPVAEAAGTPTPTAPAGGGRPGVVVEPGTIGFGGAAQAANEFKSGSEKAAEAAQAAKDQLNAAADSSRDLSMANQEATVQTNSMAQALQGVTDRVAGLANAFLIGDQISPTGESFGGVAGVANDPESLLMAADRARVAALQENIELARTGQIEGVSQEELTKMIDEFNRLSEQLSLGQRIRGGTGDDNRVTIRNTYNIETPNVESFRLSQKQLNEESNRQAEQTLRRQRRGAVTSGLR